MRESAPGELITGPAPGLRFVIVSVTRTYAPP
jgi:hypothetical protein